MSLTSRVFSLFSTTATSDPSAITTNDRPTLNATISPDATRGLHKEIDTSSATRYARGVNMLEEEEPRPPYLHVRLFLRLQNP